MKAQDLPTKNFLEDYSALAAMPETDNPALFKRLHRLIDRMHEQRNKNKAYGPGAFPTPEECTECKPGDPCWGHGIMPLVEDYRKTKK